MNITDENWKMIKTEMKKTLFKSIASINEDGSPHITPIGSLILNKEAKGIYFEIFTKKMPSNFKNNQKICILSVNSNLFFWLKSLIKGKFESPPAIRLYATVGDRRKATEKEKELWYKMVRFAKFFKGYDLMWKNGDYVRDINFTSFEPINIGVMTKHLELNNN